MKFTWETLRRGLGFESETKGKEDAERAGTKEDTEFAGEITPETGKTAAEPLEGYQRAPEDGIRVKPTPITLGDEFKIEYRGLLARAGAGKVILHCGYGPGDWRHVQDIEMEKNKEGAWTATVRATQPGRFNFCFRDNAYNWDNNNGLNWSYEIHGDAWQH